MGISRERQGEASPRGGHSCHMLVPLLMRHLSYFQLPGTRTLSCVHIIDTKDLGFWSDIIVVIFITVTRFTPSPSPFISLSLVYGWLHGISSRRCRFIFRSPRSNKEASLLLVGHCLSETSAQSVLLMSFPSSYCLLSITIINALLFPPSLLYP